MAFLKVFRFRRIFKSPGTRAAERRARKYRTVNEKRGGFFPTIPTRTTSEDAATELATPSSVSILASGTYEHVFASDESQRHARNTEAEEEIREMKIVLNDIRTVVAKKDGTIVQLKEEIAKLRNELGATKTQRDEILKLRKELSTTKTELFSIKSTLTMKKLELKARQQDVIDKDIAIQQLRNQKDDPVHSLVNLGMHIVDHLPFIKQ